MNSVFSATKRFSEQIYPSPMLILIDPELHYTFSNITYVLALQLLFSLLATFRQLNIWKWTLTKHTVRKQKKRIHKNTHRKKKKRGRGECSHKLLRLLSTFKAGMMEPKKDKYTTQIRRKVVWKGEAKQHFTCLCGNEGVTAFKSRWS